VSFTIVGRRFSRVEFEEYVQKVVLTTAFTPRFVVVHNTAIPNLSQRPEGFTEQHMTNLRAFYGSERGWAGGPHLFVDDNGIWVFNPLHRPGVHSPSWNRQSWGVELLGDFATDDPNSGRGKQVVENGIAAVATLLSKVDLRPDAFSIKFHYEDTLTDHACPGKLLSKRLFVDAVQQEMAMSQKQDGWTVYAANGEVLRFGLPSGERGTGLVRLVAESLGATLLVDGANREIRLVKGATP
jgi:hypothetical protein